MSCRMLQEYKTDMIQMNHSLNQFIKSIQTNWLAKMNHIS